MLAAWCYAAAEKLLAVVIFRNWVEESGPFSHGESQRNSAMHDLILMRIVWGTYEERSGIWCIFQQAVQPPRSISVIAFCRSVIVETFICMMVVLIYDIGSHIQPGTICPPPWAVTAMVTTLMIMLSAQSNSSSFTPYKMGIFTLTW